MDYKPGRTSCVRVYLSFLRVTRGDWKRKIVPCGSAAFASRLLSIYHVSKVQYLTDWTAQISLAGSGYCVWCRFIVVLLRACLRGGEGPQIGEATCGGSPQLSWKGDQIKMRNYMDRRVTSPTWGPPPPWKQALRIKSDKIGLEREYFGYKGLQLTDLCTWLI